MAKPVPLLLVLVVLGACASENRSPARPNVLLIFTDDQRYDSLSITGNPHIQTPALDRIAAEGALFRRAYVSTSRCCPGRAALLTGKHATAHGVWNNHPEPGTLAAHTSMADHLDGAGYRTAWIGKWHLPNPGGGPVRGFDRWVSYEGPGSHFDQAFNVDGELVESEGFQADRLTDHALEFLGEARDPDEPFFLTLAFKNPHVPMTPAPRHAGTLAHVPVALPASAFDPPSSLPAFYRVLRSATGRHAIDDEEAYARDLRAYWELMLSVDDNVQRVLDALTASGELDDTLILVTTDNGQLLGEHGLQQKGLSYEPSIQVPLLIRFPERIPAGRIMDQLVLTEDLLPTVLEVCGLEVPEDIQGRSLVPILEDPSTPWRTRFLYLAPAFGGEYGMVERAVVEERFKYISFEAAGSREELLFDRRTDPDERVNLAAQPDHASTVARMRQWMGEERRRLGDL
jgi:N-acetylglucosamine-6-sulfatase